MPENGRWQLAFWIMASICVGGFIALTPYVIANDRTRSDEDAVLRAYVDARANKNAESIIQFARENAEAHGEIKITLARISERLGINEMHKKVS